MRTRYRKLDQCQCWGVQDGDLLLKRAGWRPSSLVIARAGRTRYCHAAMVAWIHRELYLIEMIEFWGGRTQRLIDAVERQPGRWDLYQANPEYRREFDRQAAVARMREFVGQPYGRLNLIRAGLLHLPVIRLFVKPEMDDQARSKHPPHCSQAISIATADGGGVDPVPNLAPWLTEPGDLARSSFYEERCTLIP